MIKITKASNNQTGITLLSLVITIIILLLLAAVVINIFNVGNIIGNTEKTVDMHKVENMREKIQMAIAKKATSSIREITIEQIIEALEEQGIIKEGNSNIETGQVKTEPDGYVYEIKEKENGDFEVIYIGNGELTLPELLITLNPNTTGITNAVTITMTAKDESGITSYTLPNGTEQSVTSGSKEITTTYTATENGTYTFTVTNGNGTTESKSITIDNILEGTIQISASPSMPTKGNVTVTVTWPSDASKAIKEMQVGEGSWQVCTGEISSVEVMVNCTVKARVRNSVEEIKTATCEITNIDKTNPTVTAKEATVTITEGDSHSLGEYFTITANGTYGIASTGYTDTSNGNAVVSNTNTLAVGTHTIKCTVTKETGASANASVTIVVEKAGDSAADIASKLTEYCGGIVSNYTTPSGDPNVKWKIFYADSSNIYLIASDYINGNYAPNGRGGSAIYKHSDYRLSFDNVINDYAGSASILNTSITDSRVVKWISYVKDNTASTNNNIKAVAYMLDTNVWSVYKNSSYADYAIGGPTLDMFVAAYNKAHPELNIGYGHNSKGYSVGTGGASGSNNISGLNTTDSTYVISDTSKASGMWLAAPSASYPSNVMYGTFSGTLFYSYYIDDYAGVRPLVCLKSGVKLTKQADGIYLISI